ncbi:GntR family transcriptional regulator [Streptomyces sp. AC495_CC817]|uniref:GntR family transcriptional regulator n=1 Tax=Streptomyces sp. AC495_CC817 TaxID=2823900 RepID=UPI001C25A629|nr:GntR family transcriptional regulator [Streptomyces sp. AC495_CC817]
MTNEIEQFLGRSLTSTVGQPLRVAVYSRIADGIRTGVFELGSALPRETELGVALGVSRTVVREALMLLEEDGLIVTRRGIGRFVADDLPRVGLEELRPLEQALSDADDVVVRMLSFDLQSTTDFTSTNLALDPAANTWFREAVVERRGEPVAILQEHLPAGRYLSDISRTIADVLEEAATSPSSILAALRERTDVVFDSAVCEITVNVVGASRGALLGLSAAEPVLILTQTVTTGGDPVYLAKCIVSSRVGHLSVVQTTS